jgi:hypothetical protein
VDVAYVPGAGFSSPISPNRVEGVSLLKKSLLARSAVQRRPETRPKYYKNGVFSL